jgi:hypothetical protein
MIVRRGRPLEPGALCRNGMGVIEPDQPCAIGGMQRERIGQAVWTPLAGFDSLDLELDPIALFETVNASIKSQQEYKSIFVWLGVHIIS